MNPLLTFRKKLTFQYTRCPSLDGLKDGWLLALHPRLDTCCALFFKSKEMRKEDSIPSDHTY